MNAPLRQSVTEPTKWRLTISDVRKMQEAGILPPDHRCELIHGELIEMPDEGDLHSYMKARLIWWFNRHLDPGAFWIGPDTSFFLDDEEAPEPDIFITAAGVRPSQARGDTVLLVAEIADTILTFDLGVKAQLYWDYHVRKYWVIDVNARVTHVHRRGDGAWDIARIAFEDELTAALVDGVSLRLAAWG
jgi:Uma2 family endonuclease